MYTQILVIQEHPPATGEAQPSGVLYKQCEFTQLRSHFVSPFSILYVVNEPEVSHTEASIST